MTFNIRTYTMSDKGERNWRYRARLVVENIRQYEPDIIGFQELRTKPQSYLEQNLKDYDYSLAYRDKSFAKEAGAIYYRADKYKLIDEGFFWLSPTPDVMSLGWGASYHRICNYVILEEKTDGRQFAVFNTHLDHVSEEARVKGIALVLDKIHDFGDLPSILMGDFNADENSVTYASTIENFDDVKYQTENTMNLGTFQAWGEHPNPPCIDFIMISKGNFQVNEYLVQTNTYEGVYPSDHFPVCTRLELK